MSDLCRQFGLLSERGAARRLGVPVAMLRALREGGLVTAYLIRPGGFHPRVRFLMREHLKERGLELPNWAELKDGLDVLCYVPGLLDQIDLDARSAADVVLFQQGRLWLERGPKQPGRADRPTLRATGDG